MKITPNKILLILFFVLETSKQMVLKIFQMYLIAQEKF